MKGKIIAFIMLLALLLCSSYSASAARLGLPLQNQGDEKEEFKVERVVQAAAGLLTDAKEDFSNLMGSEEEYCNEKDEECMKRRMIAEAHLDYIYTQHHKP